MQNNNSQNVFVNRRKQNKTGGSPISYYPWLMKEGRHRFRREQGREYNEKSEEDQKIITDYWQTAKNGYQPTYGGNRNFDRIQRSDQPCSSAHYSGANRNYSNQSENESFSSRSSTERSSNLSTTRTNRPLSAKEIIDASTEQRKNIGSVYRLQALMSSGEILDEVFTFVGVINAYCHYDTKSFAAYPVPLEISIVNFTLRNGMMEPSTTIHLDIHPRLLLGNSVEEDFNTIKTEMKNKATWYKLPLSRFSENINDVRRAWQQFKDAWADNNNGKGRILCEKSSFLQVFSTLRILAQKSGEEEYFSKQIVKKMISMEDFALGLKDANGNRISDEKVNEYFNSLIFPQDHKYFCDVHARLSRSDNKRYYCQQSLAAVVIHKFFEYLLMEKYYQMDKIYQERTHAVRADIIGRTPSTSNTSQYNMDTAKPDGGILRPAEPIRENVFSRPIQRSGPRTKDPIEAVLDKILEEDDDEEEEDEERGAPSIYFKIISEKELRTTSKWNPIEGVEYDPFS